MAESYTSLSAEEVAVLLQMNTQQTKCSVAQQDVVPFDFRKPELLAKEQEQHLRHLQSALARIMAGSLSALLHGVVHVELECLGVVQYDAFVSGLSSAAVTAVCSLPPLEGQVVLALDPDMALVWVDYLMGGPGDTVGEVRALTEIEVMLISRVFTRILTCWRSAWQHVLEIQPILDRVEPVTELLQLAPGTATVMVFTFSVAMRHAAGEIKLCMPWSMLKPVVPKLREQVGAQEPNTATYAQEVADRLLDTPVQLRVELGSATISVMELLDLQVGDCVVLDTREGAELSIKVADETRLWGQLGVVDRNYAVSITRWDYEGDTSQDEDAGNGGAQP